MKVHSTDPDDEPLSEAEIAELKQYAREDRRVWLNRFFCSLGLLLLSCASVVPFSKGYSLHAHAEPFGRVLVWLTVGFFLLFVYCLCMIIVRWMSLRDVLKAGGS
jgi:hypothetical protein